MRTAIVTGDYFVLGETFVNRHIQHLFGGQTCVVTGRFHGTDPLGKPMFVRRTRLGLGDLAVAPYWMLRNRVRLGTSRPPFGAQERALTEFLRAHRVEAILAEFGTQALAIYTLGEELGLPVFSYFRGTDASKTLRSRRIVRAYQKMMPHLTGIIAVSQFLLDNLAAHDITHPNARVIPSGVDVRRFLPGAKRPGSFLAVGRFVEKKAPLTTVRAFAEATRDRPETTLEMVGDGPLLGAARALASELGLGDRAIFPGALPHEAVRERLATAEVFLQHSVTARDGNTEGLPTAIQEALAAGCVTIATRHAGIPEAVEDGVNGFLVAEHDTADYTARIAQLLSEGRQEAMARAARATATERFDNARLLAQLETAMTESVRDR